MRSACELENGFIERGIMDAVSGFCVDPGLVNIATAFFYFFRGFAGGRMHVWRGIIVGSVGGGSLGWDGNGMEGHERHFGMFRVRMQRGTENMYVHVFS